MAWSPARILRLDLNGKGAGQGTTRNVDRHSNSGGASAVKGERGRWRTDGSRKSSSIAGGADASGVGEV